MLEVAHNTENFAEEFITKALDSKTAIVEYALWLAFFRFPLPENIRAKIAQIHDENLKYLQNKIGILYEDNLEIIEELYSNNDVESYFLSLYHLFYNQKTADWPIIFVDSIFGVAEYKAFFLHLLGNVIPYSLANEHVRVIELLRCNDFDIKTLGLDRALKNPRVEYVEVVVENIIELSSDCDQTFCQNLLCLLAKIAQEDELIVQILCDVLQQKHFQPVTQKYLIRVIAQLGGKYAVTYDTLQQLLYTPQDISLYALDTLGDLLIHHPHYYTFLTDTLVEHTTVSLPETYRSRVIDWLVQVPACEENFVTEILSHREEKLFLAASNRVLNFSSPSAELQNFYLQTMREVFQDHALDDEALMAIFRAVAHLKPQLNESDIRVMIDCLGKEDVSTWILYTLGITNAIVSKDDFINLCYGYSHGKASKYLRSIKIELPIATFEIFWENLAQHIQDIIKENLQHNREFYRAEVHRQKAQWTDHAQKVITYLQLLHDDVGLATLLPQLDREMQCLAIKALAVVPITQEIWHIEEILQQHATQLREAFVVLSHMTTKKDATSVVANVQQQIYELLLSEDSMPQNIFAWLQKKQITVPQTLSQTLPLDDVKTIEKPEHIPHISFVAPHFTPMELLPQFLIFAKAPYPVLPDNKWIQLHECTLTVLKDPLLFDNEKIYGVLQIENNIADIEIQHYQTYSYDPQVIPSERNRLDFVVVRPNGETGRILGNCLQDLMDDYFARKINFFLVMDFAGTLLPKDNFTTRLASEYCLMVSTDKSVRKTFSNFTFFDNVQEAFIYGKDSTFTMEEKRIAYDKRQPTMDWMELEKERGITITTRSGMALDSSFTTDEKSKDISSFKKKAKKSRRQRSLPSAPPPAAGGGAAAPPPPAGAPSFGAQAPSPPPPPPPSPFIPPASQSPLQRPRPAKKEAPVYGGIGGFVDAPELELGIQPQKPRISGEKIEPVTIEPQEILEPESAQQLAIEKPTLDLLKKVQDKAPRSEYLDKVEVLPTRWFEKWLSDDAGHPGPIERLVAQSTMVMKSIQRFLGLRFIMLAHFGDVVVEAITSYVRGIFETWKNYKTIQKRLSIKNIDAQIDMMEKDLHIARQQISRAFYFVGYSVYDDKAPEATFALKLMIDLRGHLDQMKRDLAFVNAQQIQKNIQRTFKSTNI